MVVIWSFKNDKSSSYKINKITSSYKDSQVLVGVVEVFIQQFFGFSERIFDHYISSEPQMDALVVLRDLGLGPDSISE
jgi:hypothetical protein